MCSAPVSTWKYSESHFLTFSTRLQEIFCCDYVYDSLDGYNNYAYGDNNNDDDNNDSYASSFSGED